MVEIRERGPPRRACVRRLLTSDVSGREPTELRKNSPLVGPYVVPELTVIERGKHAR